MRTYSTYEAKAKFSELLGEVRAGRAVLITYRGQEVAIVRPWPPPSDDMTARFELLTARGVLGPARKFEALQPVSRSAGALERFLEDRE